MDPDARGWNMQTQEDIRAEFEAMPKATAVPPRPTRKAAPAYSHVGWLGMRAYQSFDAYWHGDGPKPMKRHACNPARDGNGYRSLCGKRIVPGMDGRSGAGDFFEGDHRESTAVVAAGLVKVNCRACLKKLGRA